MPRRQQPHQTAGAESTVALGQCFIGFAIVFEPLFGKLFSQLFKKQPLQFQPCVRRVLIRWRRGSPGHRQPFGGQSGRRRGPPQRSSRPFEWRFAARRGRR